ncbi:MAG: glycine cleavage system protein GcvH [Chloroflexi bacterium]|nr:glycine cleavage system protein GcvH [Chloroflexota bacterium]
MPSPSDRRYTQEHEWVLVEDSIGTVGITDYAQDQLGDVVYVDLPGPGTQVKHMEKFGEIESVKAVSDLFSPVSGEVFEANGALADRPELVNQSPYADGWMIRVRLSDPSQQERLLTAAQYDEFTGQSDN